MKKMILSIVIFILLFSAYLPAQEIKPGLVISKDNYEGYLPELERLLSPPDLVVCLQGLKNGWMTMRIREYEPYPACKYDRASLENHGKFKVADDNRLIGDYQNGAPFPYPETGAELAWDLFRRRSFMDNCHFIADILLFSEDGRLERSFDFHEFKRYYTGRVYIDPIPEHPGNNGVIESKENTMVLKPFDVKGFLIHRIRYEDIYKSDDVYCYIPAIRRIRRLTGSDVTDPMLGSDLIPDDFEVWRQKIDPKMTFTMRTQDLLVPIIYNLSHEKLLEDKPSYDPKVNKFCQSVEWEIRPFYVLELSTNDPNYLYSKRCIYVERDRKSFQASVGLQFDHRGRKFRACHLSVFNTAGKDYDPRGWAFASYMNLQTNHHTVMDVKVFTARADFLEDIREYFTIKGMLKRTR